MKIFLDTALVEDVHEFTKLGLVDGVTTNPSLIARSGRGMWNVFEQMFDSVPGPVSCQVHAQDALGMVAEAGTLIQEVQAQDARRMTPQGTHSSRMVDNVVIKVPLTADGLEACYELTKQGIKVNVTLCFSANQALLAAKAGATFVSPFIGRLDDAGESAVALIRDMRTIFDNYHISTEILAASIRHVEHVREVALAGADIATLPPAVLREMLHHPLTDSGLKTFVQDAARPMAQ